MEENEMSEIGRIRSHSSSSFRQHSMRSVSAETEEGDVVDASLWAAVERLPTFERLRSSLFGGEGDEEKDGRRVVDVTKLGDVERHLFIEKLIHQIENDNLKLLTKIRERIHK